MYPVDSNRINIEEKEHNHKLSCDIHKHRFENSVTLIPVYCFMAPKTNFDYFSVDNSITHKPTL